MDNTRYMPTNYGAYLRSNMTREFIIPMPIYYRALGKNKFPILNNLRASMWASGYVPDVHSSFLSFQIARKIKDGLRQKILGTGIFVENCDVIPDDLFYKFLAQTVDNMLMRGCSLGKIDIVDGNLDLTCVNMPYFNLLFGARKKIIKAKIYLNSIGLKDEQTSYVLVENRYYKNGFKKSFGRYSVERWTYEKDAFSDSKQNEVKFNDLPDNIKKWVLENNVTFEERELFDNSLGVYLFNNTWTNSGYPQSDYGESTYLMIQDLLYALDHAFTAKENDKYLGRGRVIVPKQMQSGVGNIQSTNSLINGIGSSFTGLSMGLRSAPLDNTFFNEVPSQFGNDKAKPESIQFNLRTQEWRMEIEGLIGDIASQVGLTASMLDSRIVGSGQKTAYQICSEEDITKSTVEDKRALITSALNQLFVDIQVYYKLPKQISIRWPQSGLSNYSLLSQNTVQEYNSGLISLPTAVRKLHPDWQKEEIEEEVKRLEGDNEALIQQFQEDNTEDDVDE